MLRVRVSTASAEIIETELITAGRRGLECSFEFNSAWDGLAKTVIVNGVVKRDIVLVSDTITVPGECLAREQFPLRIGVYGANAAGEIVIPTIWANFGKILPSARPSGVDPEEVTPDLVAQINKNSSDALRLAQEVLRRADSGEFDGRDGATGPAGKDGRDGIDGQYGAKGEKGDPGEDGFSPEVSVATITGGHRVTITDAQGAHVFDVMDGEGGGSVEEVYWATYNTTTEAEVTAAVTAGKTVLCKISDEIFYLVNKAAIGPSGSAWIFASVDQASIRATFVSGSYWNTISTKTIPSKTSDLTNDSGFLTSETDPTVPSWAKASSKPSYTAAEVGAYEKPASGIPASDLAAGVIPANMVLYDDSGSGTSAAETIPLVDTNGVTWYLGVDTSGVPFVGDTNNQVVWVPTQSSYASGDEVSY